MSNVMDYDYSKTKFLPSIGELQYPSPIPKGQQGSTWYGGTELDSTVLRPKSGNVFHKTQFSTFGQV